MAGLEAGHFGEACTGSDDERLCVKAGEACRLWLPCAEPEPEPEVSGGGCATTRDSGGVAGTFAALLALEACLRGLGVTIRRRTP